MIRFLLILGIILYLLYKIGSLFFRAGAASQRFRGQGPLDEHLRGESKGGQKKTHTYKGGEYIDYEEVK